MTLLHKIQIAQRNAGESVVIAKMKSQGLIPADDSNGAPSPQAPSHRLERITRAREKHTAPNTK